MREWMEFGSQEPGVRRERLGATGGLPTSAVLDRSSAILIGGRATSAIPCATQRIYFSCLLSPVSLFVCLAVVAQLILVAPISAADPVTWRTGRDLQKFLDQNIGGAGLAWSGQEVRDALSTLSRSSGIRVAMLLDRRIDPGTPLSLAMGNVTLDDALGRIAKAAKADVCQVGSVMYFGPASLTQRLRTIAELRKQEIRALPPADAKPFVVLKPLKWDELAEPRALLKAMAAEANATIENLDVVPHDLWAAADLPAMPLADRLSIVAAAYDLTFAIQPGAATLRLEPIPERVTIKRTYSVGKNAGEVAEKLSSTFTNCKISVAGTRIEVEGRVEDQLQILAALAGKPVKKPSAAGDSPVGEVSLDRTRVDAFVATNQQLGALIKAVAQKLNMEAEFDGPALIEAKISVDQIVSIELKSGTIRDLLNKITKPYGLEYEIDGKKLLIRPIAKKKP
jgi:hypothetical protein